MKHFDQKWQKCAAHARSQPPEPVAMPFGFADRVLRRCARSEPVSFSDETLWLRLGWRTLIAVSTVLIVFAVVQLTMDSRSPRLRPQIEHTIVDYSGIL